MPELRDVGVVFQGPSRTHFALGSRFLAVLSEDRETIVPNSDLIEFLFYLAEAAAPFSFTGPEGPTLFVVDGEILHVHGLDAGDVSLPLTDLETFLQFLTRTLEGSASTEESGLTVPHGIEELDD